MVGGLGFFGCVWWGLFRGAEAKSDSQNLYACYRSQRMHSGERGVIHIHKQCPPIGRHVARHDLTNLTAAANHLMQPTTSELSTRSLRQLLNETGGLIARERARLEERSSLAGRVAGTWRARWRARRKRRRDALAGQQKQEGGALASPLTSATKPARSSLLLVLGVITNPRTPHTRKWIRSTYMARVSTDPRVVLRFALGRRGLSDADRKKLDAEHRLHADLEYIDASDFAERGGIFSCIDKLFAWFPHAVTAYPGAAFYAKADDDSYVDVGRLLAMLSPLASVRNVYMGYVQYDSFVTDEWKHCGWSAGPVGAAHAMRHGACPSGGRAYGPFPFVVGALTLMGADLAAWMHASPYIRALVAAGRASQTSRAHWDCGYSDVTLGYALARANLSISLVPVRNGMRDATYGAMTARRFVVAHHLRTYKQFADAHSEARGAGAWEAVHRPCTRWARVAEMVGTAESRSRDELQAAMGAFPCCQQWDVCEVSPRAE